jgi:PAS domain
MAYSEIDIQFNDVSGGVAAPGEYSEWTDHRIPDDRSAWHPLVQQFYDYWLSIAPPDALPGRQHVAPEQMIAWLSRLWLLDVYRAPLRYRLRVCGSAMVRSLGQEVTGRWLDEVHPQSAADPGSGDRLRIAVERGRPTWRRGVPRWPRAPEVKAAESLMVPLAADGCTVDKLMGVSIAFDAKGRMV